MTTERTKAGEQHILAGAERISDGDLAKRKAREPLRPRKPQLPCDVGLFGDDADQVDLMDLIWGTEP